MKRITCPTCGAPCRVAGDDKEGTHYYVPIGSVLLLAAAKAVVDAYQEHSHRSGTAKMNCPMCELERVVEGIKEHVS